MDPATPLSSPKTIPSHGTLPSQGTPAGAWGRHPPNRCPSLMSLSPLEGSWVPNAPPEPDMAAPASTTITNTNRNKQITTNTPHIPAAANTFETPKGQKGVQGVKPAASPCTYSPLIAGTARPQNLTSPVKPMKSANLGPSLAHRRRMSNSIPAPLLTNESTDDLLQGSYHSMLGDRDGGNTPTNTTPTAARGQQQRITALSRAMTRSVMRSHATRPEAHSSMSMHSNMASPTPCYFHGDGATTPALRNPQVDECCTAAERLIRDVEHALRQLESHRTNVRRADRFARLDTVTWEQWSVVLSLCWAVLSLLLRRASKARGVGWARAAVFSGVALIPAVVVSMMANWRLQRQSRLITKLENVVALSSVTRRADTATNTSPVVAEPLTPMTVARGGSFRTPKQSVPTQTAPTCDSPPTPMSQTAPLFQVLAT